MATPRVPKSGSSTRIDVTPPGATPPGTRGPPSPRRNTNTRRAANLMHSACMQGLSTEVETMIRTGKDRGDDVITLEAEGMKPIHTAAKAGQLQTVKILLHHSANGIEPDGAGMTPLHHAVNTGGHASKVVSLLLERYPEFDVCTARDAKGRSVWDLALIKKGMAAQLMSEMRFLPTVLIDECKSLDLSKGGLDRVPEHVRHLKNLETLLLKDNKIKDLPYFLGFMDRLQTIDLHGLKLTAPPALVVKQGTEAVKQYLRDSSEGKEGWRRIKLVVLGHGRAGKTTLLRSFVALKGKDTRFGDRDRLERRLSSAHFDKNDAERAKSKHLSVADSHAPKAKASMTTIGIDVLENANEYFKEDISFSVWDFAGQLQYLTTHQYFLSTHNAVYVLCVDLSLPDSEQDNQLLHWIYFMRGKLTGTASTSPDKHTYKLLLVGTKRDLLQKKLTPEQEKKYLERRSDDLRRVMKEHDFQIEHEIYFVSFKDPQAVVALRKDIVRQSEAILSNQACCKIPMWYRLIGDRILELAERSPLMFLRLARLKRELVMESMADGKCMEALEYLHNIGLVVLEHESQTICIRPVLLAKLMALFVGTEEHQSTLLGKLSLRSNNSIVTRENAIECFNRVMDLMDKSEMQLKDEDEKDQFLKVLQLFELCYELNSEEMGTYNGARGFMFPALRPRGEMLQMPPPDLTNKKTRPKFVGREYGGGTRTHHIPTEFYARLQVRLRSYHDKRYKLFSNGMFIRDQELRASAADYATRHETTALVVLHSELVQGVEKRVQTIKVVVTGDEPSIFVQKIDEVVEHLRETDFAGTEITKAQLCPKCVQIQGLYTTIGDKEVREDVFECNQGHECTRKQVTFGADFDDQLGSHNVLWSPQYGHTFYKESEWEAPQAMADGFEFHNLRMTELREGERNHARQAEFARVRDMFYSFVGRDKKNYKLDKIVFIDNPALEKRFQGAYQKIMSRTRLVASQNGARTPDEPCGRKFDPALGEFVYRDGDSTPDMLQRKLFMEHFESYAARVSGNENVNLVAGWHGTSEEIIFKIAESNFRNPRPKEEQKPGEVWDEGYFGRGIYLTQYPSYGEVYIKTKPGEDPPPLLLSWVLMGSVFPVIEQPNPTDPRSLYGKECMPGYDSHYSLVKQAGNDKMFVPIKCKDDGEWEKPDYDELVVFTNDHILPRYMIYYKEGGGGDDLDLAIDYDVAEDGAVNLEHMRAYGQGALSSSTASRMSISVSSQSSSVDSDEDFDTQSTMSSISTIDESWLVGDSQSSLSPHAAGTTGSRIRRGSMTKPTSVVMWVDPDVKRTRAMAKEIVKSTTGVKILHVTSTDELLVKLRDNEKVLIDQYHHNDRLRIVTNRSRPGDGDQYAGSNLMDKLNAEKKWKKIPVLLFCGNETAVSHLHKPAEWHFVTADSIKAAAYMRMDKFKDIDKSWKTKKGLFG